MHVIVDTDAGADDLMAISFLLSRRDVRIDAITVANGVAHVRAGARNILRLLSLAGRADIPVYIGRDGPLTGSAAFPAEWRKAADELPGVTLPRLARIPQTEPAARFLARRLSNRQSPVRSPVRVLALGPLTNIAEALDAAPAAAHNIPDIVVMGGAFGVPGNLGDAGASYNSNTVSEWNMFVDPSAAAKVFAAASPSAPGSTPKLRLVPLDATRKVPIDSAFLAKFTRDARTPLAHFVAQVLGTNRNLIAQGAYFAWDPLAAVALVDPEVLRTRCFAVAVVQEVRQEVRQDTKDAGRTIEATGRPPNACVAVGADAGAFYKIFLSALEPGSEALTTPR
jgi:inosine-uridine nucleoside N-ribohydrolase